MFKNKDKKYWKGKNKEKRANFKHLSALKHTIGISKMVLTLCESNAKTHQETGNFGWMNSAVHTKSAAFP